MDTTGTNLHRYVASDEYGYSLGYFAGDYSEINTPTNEWLADKSGTELQDSTYGLYNGNISRMVTSIREFVQGNSNEIFANVYRYDQLNRLTKTRNYTSNDVISSNNWNSASMNNDYGVNISYDKNGNILTLDRNADVNSNSNFDAMDKLEYVYEDTLNGYPRNTNKLLSVDEQRDNSGNSMAGYDDIKPGQISGDNYAYDDIGNLIEDEQQEIEEIEWTITGKVKSVSRTSSSTKPDLEFEYDPLGNRIHKKVINKNSQYLLANVVDYYYIRDAQGNIMSIYKTMNNEIGNTIESTFSQADNPIYGSDRIGVQERNQWLVKQEYSTQSGNPILVSTDYFAGNGNVKDQYRGDKDYELKNHLGNVLAVVSDKRTPVFNTVTQNFENFDAIVLGAQEYYPFGSILPSRSYNSTEYRFSFNGKEKDPEFTGTNSHLNFGARIYNSNIGGFLSLDPKMKQYPSLSPYIYAADNPIMYIDEDGEGPFLPLIRLWLQHKGKGIIVKQSSWEISVATASATSTSGAIYDKYGVTTFNAKYSTWYPSEHESSFGFEGPFSIGGMYDEDARYANDYFAFNYGESSAGPFDIIGKYGDFNGLEFGLGFGYKRLDASEFDYASVTWDEYEEFNSQLTTFYGDHGIETSHKLEVGDAIKNDEGEVTGYEATYTFTGYTAWGKKVEHTVEGTTGVTQDESGDDITNNRFESYEYQKAKNKED